MGELGEHFPCVFFAYIVGPGGLLSQLCKEKSSRVFTRPSYLSIEGPTYYLPTLGP